ncbi:unnamed protein product, partial [Rotaria socialis]
MERRQMEERTILVRQIARRLRNISDETDQQQSTLSLFVSIKRRFVTIFYSFMSRYYLT